MKLIMYIFSLHLSIFCVFSLKNACLKDAFVSPLICVGTTWDHHEVNLQSKYFQNMCIFTFTIRYQVGLLDPSLGSILPLLQYITCLYRKHLYKNGIKKVIDILSVSKSQNTGSNPCNPVFIPS